MTENVILDPTDADLFHTDVTCRGLWVLADRVESSLGAPVDGPEALVEQAAADGLLVLDGVVGGMRCCRHCRPGAAAVEAWPLAA